LVPMKRFCYRCGALEDEAGPLIQGLCQRCFSEVPLLQLPAEVEVVLCKRCGAVRIGRQWQLQSSGASVEDAVRQAVLHVVRVTRDTEAGRKFLRPEEAGVQVEVNPRLKEGLVDVRASGRVHHLQVNPKVEEATLKLNLKYTTCNLCSLKRARHYEAILQLRDFPSRETRLRVQEEMERLAAQSSKVKPGNFIAEVKEHHGGLDFYLSSVSLARMMAARLKESFGATTVESAKLIGQTKNGRRKYRVSILARFK